jgi:hypothetical protein
MLFVDDYEFDRSHPFFDQALQIYAAAVLHRLVLTPGIPFLWIKDGHYRLEINDVAKFEACVRNSELPESFAVRPTFWTDSDPEQSALDRAANPPKLLVAGELINTAAIFALNHAYESHREALVQLFGSALPGRWPQDLQLFRHVRNGCSHGNTFDIRLNRDRSEPIDPSAPPEWEHLRLADRVSMTGKQVVGEFLAFSFVLPFLHDIGRRLRDLGVATSPHGPGQQAVAADGRALS